MLRPNKNIAWSPHVEHLEQTLIDATQYVLTLRQADLTEALGRVERSWFTDDLAAALRQRGCPTSVEQAGSAPDLQIVDSTTGEEAVVELRAVPTNYGRS